jgi:hypothetical protein
MDTLINLLSVLCLTVVGLLCILGVFHPQYDDTLGERVGMSAIGLWSIAKVSAILSGGAEEFPALLLHAGLASFACGMAAAKWRHRRMRPSRFSRGVT